MILQPLVENAVRYAVAKSSGPVELLIAARSYLAGGRERLVLEVSDDGPGGVQQQHGDDNGDAGGFGIGLANVRDRLAARYGEDASLTAGSRVGGGWANTIDLPLVRHG